MSRHTMADGITPCVDPDLLAARAAWAAGVKETPVALLSAQADDIIAATRVSRAVIAAKGTQHLRTHQTGREHTSQGVRVGWLAARERQAEQERAATMGRLR